MVQGHRHNAEWDWAQVPAPKIWNGVDTNIDVRPEIYYRYVQAVERSSNRSRIVVVTTVVSGYGESDSRRQDRPLFASCSVIDDRRVVIYLQWCIRDFRSGRFSNLSFLPPNLLAHPVSRSSSVTLISERVPVRCSPLAASSMTAGRRSKHTHCARRYILCRKWLLTMQ